MHYGIIVGNTHTSTNDTSNNTGSATPSASEAAASATWPDKCLHNFLSYGYCCYVYQLIIITVMSISCMCQLCHVMICMLYCYVDVCLIVVPGQRELGAQYVGCLFASLQTINHAEVS